MQEFNSREAVAKKQAERKAREKEKEKKMKRLLLILAGILLVALSLLFGFITGNYLVGIIVTIVVVVVCIACGYCLSLFSCFGTDIKAGYSNEKREWHTQEDRIIK